MTFLLNFFDELRRRVIQKLMPGETYGTPFGLSLFYLMCGELDRAAEWWEKVIEQRITAIEMTALICSSSSPRWPRIAGPMNLPEKAGSPAS